MTEEARPNPSFGKCVPKGNVLPISPPERRPSSAPAGPPITEGEWQNFILAIRRCWNVDVRSEAASVNVTIRFNMTPDGMPVSSSIMQVSATGGSEAAQRAAYDSGRRAVLRCASDDGGYNLPPVKYDHWQQVDVTFNPAEMRVR
ncbi:hypothetical protein [Palleronia marisminoris]|uniref:hypothetical protein n=1 Tax=Palleronia marisminoris TaxID=315423 RepID=UPI001114170A|nr:hypothetical protein [Palleronia marisminoris]